MEAQTFPILHKLKNLFFAISGIWIYKSSHDERFEQLRNQLIKAYFGPNALLTEMESANKNTVNTLLDALEQKGVIERLKSQKVADNVSNKALEVVKKSESKHLKS